MDSQVFGGKSDPYIVIHTDPVEILDSKQSTLKSSVIKHDINPIWPKKENMNIKICSSDLLGLKENSHLFISLWDEDRLNADDLIGIFSLSFDEILTFYETKINKNNNNEHSNTNTTTTTTTTTSSSIAYVINKHPIYNNGRITGYFSAELSLVGSLPKRDVNRAHAREHNDTDANNQHASCQCCIQ